MNGHTDALTEVCPLSSLHLGDCATVKHIGGGKLMSQRMGMIGIRSGVDICVVHGPGQRGAVLRVGGAQIALGRAIIDNIRVVPTGRGNGGRP